MALSPKILLDKLRKRTETSGTPNAFLQNSALLEQIDHERAVYLEVFQKQLKSLTDQGIAYQTEVELVPEKKRKQTMPPLRIDALYQEAGELKEVEANIANPPYFEVIKEDWDDIIMSLSPFVWNAVEFEVIGPYPNLEQLSNWYTKWYDIKHRNKADENGFKSVVHKMSAPTEIEDGWHIQIDFGSANLDALIAFYKQCRFNDAEAISISSKRYFESFSGGHNFSSKKTQSAINTTAQPIQSIYCLSLASIGAPPHFIKPATR